MKGLKKENNHKRTFMDNFLGWARKVEPTLGTDEGMPDLLVVAEELGYIVPVEFKKGEFKNGLLKTERVRPSQIECARQLRSIGVPVMLVVGVPSGALFIIDGELLPFWKKGFNAAVVQPLWPADDDWSIDALFVKAVKEAKARLKR